MGEEDGHKLKVGGGSSGYISRTCSMKSTLDQKDSGCPAVFRSCVLVITGQGQTAEHQLLISVHFQGRIGNGSASCVCKVGGREEAFPGVVKLWKQNF